MVALKRKGNTKVRTENGKTIVGLHDTDIVEFDENTITLNTGGWKSITTKQRMNQASFEFDLGYTIMQKNYEWFIEYKGETIPFTDRTYTLDRV